MNTMWVTQLTPFQVWFKNCFEFSHIITMFWGFFLGNVLWFLL